jgi:hypothetical protein
MKKSLFAFAILCFAALASFAQSATNLQAQVYNFEQSITQGKSSFKLFVQPTAGSIKVGDKIDAISRNGDRFTFQVTKVTVGGAAAQKIAVGQKGEAMVKPLIDEAMVDRFTSAFDVEMPWVSQGANVPTGIQEPLVVEAEPLPLQDLNCSFNGQARIASSFGNSNLFYTKGITGMQNGEPFLILAFKTADGNQFTFVWKTNIGKVGIVDFHQLEVVYSGTEGGKDVYLSNHVSGRADKPLTPFSMEITQWKVISPDEVECAVKFSGTLYQLMSGESAKLSSGVIMPTRVTVYNERY